jgi:CubicO group peptidase (beta-lactamase class C family)
MKRCSLIFLWALLMSCLLLHAGEPPQAAVSAKARSSQIDKIVRDTMQRHRIPGAAVAVVFSDGTSMQKGYGVTSVNQPSRVNKDTLFKVGSISKSITALGIGLLVQDGKLNWDDKLSTHISALNEVNPAVAQLTIRHLLLHQTGLDLDRLELLLWPQPNAFTFDNVLAGLRVIQKLDQGATENKTNIKPFRYSNMNYMLAGEVIQRVSGLTYGEFVQRRIFAPLGMDCTAGTLDRRLNSNVAQPHILINDAVRVVRQDGGVVPEGLDSAAGGVRCSARAMQRWIAFQLDPTKSGLQITDRIWRELHTRQVASATGFDLLDANSVESYGLGLQLTVMDGDIQYDHYGGVAGMLSYFAVYPSRGAAFAVLLNTSAVEGRKQLIDQLKLLTTKPATPARAVANTISPVTPVPATPAHAKPKTTMLAIKPRAPNTKTRASLSGRYRDAWFGEISLCPRGKKIRAEATSSPRMTGKLVRIKDDRVAILWDDLALNSDAVIDVTETRDGQVQRFAFTPHTQADFDFSALAFERIGACP